MIAIRGSLSTLGGALLAAALFFALAQLVSVPFDVRPSVSATRIDFTRQIIETTPESKREEKVTRDPPALQPAEPTVITDVFGDPEVTPLKPARPELAPGGRGHGLEMNGIDGDVIPRVRVNPEYPPRAIAGLIEGWVQVRFTVTAIGSVRDATVVASEPGTIFDEAALKAIARWRYNPRVANGEAVERVGLQTVIRFELEN
jgi:periplasmic protein TonB